MKPIEITEENFESLLAYDDLFLDYFNAFLQYPAFPQPLYYNRLTGSFQEVEDEGVYYGSLSTPSREGRRGLYGPADAEQERIMDWAKRKRLPLFLRTRLFLEYKLCKLLIRPLEDRRSTSRTSSFGLRGYSRETTSYSSTSMSLVQSNEASEYDNDSDFSWPGDADRHILFKHMRPGSRCISMPPMLGLTVNGALWSPVIDYGSYLTKAISPKKKSRQKESSRRDLSSKVQVVQDSLAVEQDIGHGDGGSAETQEITSPAKSSGLVKAGKSALRKGSSKRNSPKKHATIRTPTATSSQLKTTSSTEMSVHIADSSSEEEESEDEDDCSIDDDDEDDDEDVDEEEEAKNDEQNEGVEGEAATENAANHVGETEKDSSIKDPEGTEGVRKDSLFEPDIEITENEEEEPEQSFLNYNVEDELLVDDTRTVTEIRQVEAKHHITFHQLKEEILGSLFGMELFKTFLAGTVGEDMLNFWLDCEMYRDNVQALEDGADMTRTRLFRNIQDKYRLKLTPEAQRQIKQAQGNIGLSDSVFTRTQYDVLRRLRSYWVARFLIHQEKTGEYSYDSLREQHQRLMEEAKKPISTFLPSISFVNSLPVRPSSCFRLATTQTDWTQVAKGGRQMEEFVRPGHLMHMDETKYIPRPMSARFHVGLASDKDAGKPFQNYLERHTDRQLLAYLLFWQDVSDYLVAEDRSADRLLLVSHAWSIFNKYIMDGGVWNIDLPQGERDFIHTTLLQTSDFAQASLFDRAKEHVVRMLQREWLYYLKEDLKVFLDCRGRPEDRIMSASSRKSSYTERSAASRRESVLSRLDSAEAKTVVKKKTKGGGKGGKGDGPESQAEREALKKQLEEKKRKQIAMQRKVVRQARARQQEAKKGGKTSKQQGVKFDGKDQKDSTGKEGGGDDGGGDGKKPEEEKETTFKKSFRNKSTMNLFRTFVTDFETKDTSNMVQMFFDIDIFWRIPENQADKRQAVLKQIFSNYFDQNSKKSLSLSREIMSRQNNEGERLSNKTIDMTQKYIAPYIEEAFSNFWAQSGQQMPTGQDKNEFQSTLIKSARGTVSHKLMTFHRYLMEYNDKDGGSQYLDKDLIFYLEAQRFKEACHSNADINLLKRKVEVILDCFIDSPLSPSGVLIDIPSEGASRVMKKADVFLKDGGKDPHNPNFFDDPQYTVFKEMLPYWAAFTKRYQPPAQSQNRLSSSKYERLSKQRLKLFMDMKEPNTDYKLPAINTPPQNKTGGTGITFSISDGLQWKAHDPSDVLNDLASEVGSIAARSVRDSSSTPGTKHRNMATRGSGMSSVESTPSRPTRVSVPPRLSVLVQD